MRLFVGLALMFAACDDTEKTTSSTDGAATDGTVASDTDTDTDADADTDTDADADTDTDTTSDTGMASIDPDDLQDWVRTADPVLRDPVPGYEVAADPHVFVHDGQLQMVYVGDEGDFPSVKLATGSDWTSWSTTSTLLGSGSPQWKETPFHREAADGSHQLFFIGYDDETTYRSEIYRAEAPDLHGPWTIVNEPLMTLGQQAGHEVEVMTSPSLVEKDGTLHMVWLAWDHPHDDVTQVWVHGATSDDDGRTWSDPEEVDVPVGMEGQLTEGPDGRFYATSMGQLPGGEGIFLAVADAPFGPYEALPEPILVKSGSDLERHEANAPSLVFDAAAREAHLYYHGADYYTGYWVLHASTSY